MASARWKLLKTLLTTKDEKQLAQLLAQPGSGSKRAQPRFRVFDKRASKHGEEQASSTTLYYFLDSPQGGQPLFTIKEVAPKVDVKDAFGQYSGFLNTGNICVWPAEEILAFYVCSHPEIVRGKTVIELGGGMTAMAGVAAAGWHGGASKTILTDGNPDCVSSTLRLVPSYSLIFRMQTCVRLPS